LNERLKPRLLLGFALLAASAGAMAQPGRFEERRAKVKAAQARAQEACKGTKGAERSDCMRRQLCEQAPDAKACEERLSRLKDAHDAARHACEGKIGDEARECMQAQMCAQATDPARCDERRKARAAERARLREACKGKMGGELRSCVRENRNPK
jgi:hypothetical protein